MTLETYIAKLKHILPTFFAITFGTVFGLTLLRWLLCIQYSLFDIREEIWTMLLPVIFPWIPIILWLRPRFRVLTFKKANADYTRSFFEVIAWIVIGVTLFISQAWLTTATGKLKTLSSIKEIEKVEKVRYYKLTNFSVATDFTGSYTIFNTSGKINKYLSFNIFFVFPIVANSSEQITDTPKYWYGVNYYKKQICNTISDEEKERKYKAFYDECVQKINNYNFYSLDHFERKPTSIDKTNFLKAIEAQINQPTDESFVVFVPIQETYVSRNGHKFAWIFGSFGIGLGVLLFALLFPGFSEDERKRSLLGKKQQQDDIVNTLNFLIPKGTHFVTSIILVLNILVFLLMVFFGVHIISPNGKELLDWGGNRRFETTNGEWWRLLTSMFLHSGVMHLLLNISGFIIAAIFVEPLLGRKKYFILYILSGLCGSLASICWYPDTVSVGASGAIFGLYGAILGLLLTNAFANSVKKNILIMIGIYVGINLILGLIGNADNAAHIGGLLSGALIGIMLHQLDGGKKNRV